MGHKTNKIRRKIGSSEKYRMKQACLRRARKQATSKNREFQRRAKWARHQGSAVEISSMEEDDESGPFMAPKIDS